MFGFVETKYNINVLESLKDASDTHVCRNIISYDTYIPVSM